MINITINNKPVQAHEGDTILMAAKKLGYKIPTLCHLKLEDCNFESKNGSCRICVVEVANRSNLAPACCTPVAQGMNITTNSVRVMKARRTVLDLILSDHPKDCLTCSKNNYCELQDLASSMGLHKVKYAGKMSKHGVHISSRSIARDLNKCIMCRRCEMVCNEVQTVGAISGVGRGFQATVEVAGLKSLAESKCVNCGQCVNVCPVGAMTAKDSTLKVWAEINNPKKTVVVQTAPAVRAAIGECFGIEAGTATTGKMVSALRLLGFDKVFDTDFSADVTIMEEVTEFIDRVTKGENLPIITSCCPGWVKFFEHQYSDLMHLPSTCKSPQQMFGALAKTYYADKIGIKAEDMTVVSVMPCIAKKFECNREEFNSSGAKDVDIVLSTREFVDMIKQAGILFADLEDSEFDDPMGESTGAAVIFGNSGGVMEAALRTAYHMITKKELDSVDFTAVRGMQGVKEATVQVGDIAVKAAISSGLGNARKLLDKIRSGKADYHIIEIMACPGGCINGGGQPYLRGDSSKLVKRMHSLYSNDKIKKFRKSHLNPSIIKLYKDFLEKPGGHKSHKLLHTSYIVRPDI